MAKDRDLHVLRRVARARHDPEEAAEHQVQDRQHHGPGMLHVLSGRRIAVLASLSQLPLLCGRDDPASFDGQAEPNQI